MTGASLSRQKEGTLKPVKQTKRGGPNVPPEERGDCWSACIASILEVPIEAVPVPHSDDEDFHWWDATQRALRPHGFEVVVGSVSIYPSGYWMAVVPSLNLGTFDDGRPVPHIIVMDGPYVAHDPSLGKCYEAGTTIDQLDVKDAYVLASLNPRSVLADAA